MPQKLQTVLTATPDSQIPTVVGMSLARLDFDNLSLQNRHPRSRLKGGRLLETRANRARCPTRSG